MCNDLDDIPGRELVDEIIKRGPDCIDDAIDRLVPVIDAPAHMKRRIMAELDDYRYNTKLIDQRAMDEYLARLGG